MKFKYGDEVEVIEGFYKGQKGKVVSTWFFRTQYLVDFITSGIGFKFISSRYLKAIK